MGAVAQVNVGVGSTGVGRLKKYPTFERSLLLGIYRYELSYNQHLLPAAVTIGSSV